MLLFIGIVPEEIILEAILEKHKVVQSSQFFTYKVRFTTQKWKVMYLREKN